ncbi:PLP-dependent aminotransferase family protein [Longispora sp. NPDC051575]|uniref:aminotransferase-like domain-containing protein n=1 Tax=Longispora sp. NPDC051575 TaxID=3154943 RepID=UPI00343E02CD
MRDYRNVADAVAADIDGGRLRPGDRLPTQRAFAREHGLAPSTVHRVYRELVRRGLVTGEVGRGTFVRAAGEFAALGEPADQPVDLELSVPAVPGQFAPLAADLAPLLRPDVLAAALRPVGVAGTPGARAAAAHALTRSGWTPDGGRILFAGSGRQAIAGAVAALVPPGGRLGVEEFTYPVVRALAGRLGVTLVPLPVDDDGLRPDGVAAAHRAGGLHAVYLQPTLHNPLCVTMSGARRSDLADLAGRLDLRLIEDAVWSYLDPAATPLAALAPDHTILVDSLSKRLAPGLTTGFAVAPPHLTDRLAEALRSGAWTPQRFALDAATRWIADGTLAAVEAAKRADARARQDLVRTLLGGLGVRTAPGAYLCWWELPRRWRPEVFAGAAARRGIAVTVGSAFTAAPHRTPNAVRLGLASPPLDVLAQALATLATLARSAPEDID